jgi:hypothetical protein
MISMWSRHRSRACIHRISRRGDRRRQSPVRNRVLSHRPVLRRVSSESAGPGISQERPSVGNLRLNPPGSSRGSHEPRPGNLRQTPWPPPVRSQADSPSAPSIATILPIIPRFGYG